MPVQQVALSEVEMIQASDDALEQMIGLQAGAASMPGICNMPMSMVPPFCG